MSNRLIAAAIAASSLFLPLAAQAQATYTGNGLTGFGGTLGNGSLAVSSNATAGTVTFTFHPAGTFSGNDVVVYIDSQPGGLADTSSLVDNGDPSREAISGYNANNPSRTQVNFASGFGADYALSFQNNAYIGLFSVPTGSNTYLNYIDGTAPTSGGPYTITLPDAELGLTPAQSFNFVGTLIDPNAAYRSNETLGLSVTVPGTVGDTPNAGFTGTTTFANFDTFAPTPAPEPSGTVSLLVGAGVLGSGIVWRRRKASKV